MSNTNWQYYARNGGYKIWRKRVAKEHPQVWLYQATRGETPPKVEAGFSRLSTLLALKNLNMVDTVLD